MAAAAMLFAVVSDDKMLTPARWASAIRDSGFDMELDTDFDVRTLSDFLPCKYDGKDAGFECFWSKVDPTSLDDHVAARIDKRNIAVSFNTHSDLRELVSSIIASAVLCASPDGVLWDTEGDELVSAIDVLDWTREWDEASRAT